MSKKDLLILLLKNLTLKQKIIYLASIIIGLYIAFFLFSFLFILLAIITSIYLVSSMFERLRPRQKKKFVIHFENFNFNTDQEESKRPMKEINPKNNEKKD